MVKTKPLYFYLFVIGSFHLLNDCITTVIPSMNVLFEQKMNLTYTQIGLIIFLLNISSSFLQPLVGSFGDKKHSRNLLSIGFIFTIIGIVLLAICKSYLVLLFSVIFIGIGSAVFHPESSRSAHLLSRGKKGISQSIYQVGGNAGHAIAPLLTMVIIVPFGKMAVLLFLPLLVVAFFYSRSPRHLTGSDAQKRSPKRGTDSKGIPFGVKLLMLLVFIRSWYHACIANYYQFYLVKKYGLPMEKTLIYIFLFLLAGAIGTLIGGILSDRFGNRNVILFSMMATIPFSIVLPFVPTNLAYIVIFINGLIILSNFSVTVVFAQELLQERIGLASGLISGFAIGMGAVGSVLLGVIADKIGIESTVIALSILPALGIFSIFLPKENQKPEMVRSLQV